MVIFAVLGLAAVSAAVVSTSLFRYGAARGVHEAERAFQAASSGIDLALYELQEGVDLTGDETGEVTGEIFGCSYAVTVAPAYTGKGEYTLTASARQGRTRSGIEVIVSSDRNVGYAILAKEGLSLNGSFMVDSYDSRLGSYPSQVFGDHAKDGGDVSSNWNILTSAPVWGDARPGPTFQVLGDPSNVSGSTSPAPFPVTVRSIPYEPVSASLGEYSGSSLLAGGVHRYSSLRMSSRDTLTIDGDVTLYVDGDFKMSGRAQILVQTGANLTIYHGSGDVSLTGAGIVNQEASPASVSFISSTTGDFKYAGNASFYGLVYAPEAAMTVVGNADFHGAIVARDAQFRGNGAVHYDEALQLPEGLVPPFRLESAYPSGD